MSKRSGFTLVELLVVIAIIALLIAILVPSLATARDLAKQLYCLNNLRNIGNAINVYAEVYKGWVPYFYTEDGEPADVTPPRFLLAYVYDEGETRPVNLGRLYAQGFVEDPETFYCPFPHEQKGYSSPDEYGEPWGEWPLSIDYSYPGSVAIGMGYSYNPHLDQTTWTQRRYRKVDQFPPDAIVTMDALCSGGEKWVVHRLGGLSFNVHYIDAHAENITWPYDELVDQGISHVAGQFEHVLGVLESR